MANSERNVDSDRLDAWLAGPGRYVVPVTFLLIAVCGIVLAVLA